LNYLQNNVSYIYVAFLGNVLGGGCKGYTGPCTFY